MSEEVKRYQQYAPLTEATDALVRLYPGATQYVLASDHDRIVAELQAQVEQLTAERDQLKEFASASGFVGLVFERDTLRAEVERLRKDAERYRWARRPESGNALFTLTGSGECGPNMDSAIDAAMEASL